MAGAPPRVGQRERSMQVFLSAVSCAWVNSQLLICFAAFRPATKRAARIKRMNFIFVAEVYDEVLSFLDVSAVC